MPTFPCRTLSPSGALFALIDKVPGGVQGARHSQFGQFLSDIHLNKVNSGLLSNGPELKFLNGNFLSKPKIRENLSFLTIGSPKENPKKNDTQAVKFMLFGKPILTEQQISESSSDDSTRSTISNSNVEKMGNSSGDSNGTLGRSSDEGYPSYVDQQKTMLRLSAFGSYEELYKKITQYVWQGKVREAERCAL